jgi:hypothetical protein
MTTPAEALQERMQALITIGIRNGQENDARTQQSRAGQLGPSDFGFCRQKAVLMTKGVSASDAKPMWAAAVGTALHAYVGGVLGAQFPDWIIEGRGSKVTATLPRTGAEVSGTPDYIVPNENLLLDLKSADGLATVRRQGPSLNHKMQRHLYAMGAVAAGLLDGDRPVYVGNVYVDRSGKDADPYVTIEEFDPGFTDEIDSWVEDVIYAVRNGEDSNRDVAAAVCEKICEFYTACRGALPMRDSEPITDPTIIGAIDQYVEGRDMEKLGKRLKAEAAAVLDGINGSDGRFQVRWVTTPGSDVPGYYRNESTRIDVRKVRRQS